MDKTLPPECLGRDNWTVFTNYNRFIHEVKQNQPLSAGNKVLNILHQIGRKQNYLKIKNTPQSTSDAPLISQTSASDPMIDSSTLWSILIPNVEKICMFNFILCFCPHIDNRGSYNSPWWVLDSLFSVGTHQPKFSNFQFLPFWNTAKFSEMSSGLIKLNCYKYSWTNILQF